MKLKEKLGIGYIRFQLKILAAFAPQKAARLAFRLFCTPQHQEAMASPAIFNLAESASFPFGEHRVKGYRWNQLKPKKYLVLHGFNSRAYKFHWYISTLVNMGHQVLAFDAPAHGKSKGKTINADEYRQLIEAIMEKYGPFDGFIAHSFGGLALALAIENLGGTTSSSKLVLIAPATETVTSLNIALQQLQITQPSVKKALEQLIIETSGHPVDWFSVNRAILRFNNPVLWVHDENDRITPYADAKITKDKDLPHVTFLTTQHLGHRKIYHNDAVKQQVIAFLQ